MELTSVCNTSRRFCQSSAGREDSLRMKVSIGVSSTWPRGAMPWRLMVVVVVWVGGQPGILCHGSCKEKENGSFRLAPLFILIPTLECCCRKISILGAKRSTQQNRTHFHFHFLNHSYYSYAMQSMEYIVQ